MPESAVYVLEKMAHGYKRMGRAAGAGFYDYGVQPASLWSGLKTFERRSRQLPPDVVRDRLLDAATLAALGLVQPHPAHPALAALLGAAVPLDAAQARARIGADGEETFADRCRALAARFGPRFEPPADLAARR
jgi:3-hydroxyacyl-CoA dehydrogenase/enoyl-CoA hydratase/3-hydroxybutyryl-CoA epimerase